MKTRILMTGADNSPGGVLGYINSLIAHGDPDRFSFHITSSILPGEAGPNYLHPRAKPQLLPSAGSMGSFWRQVFRLRRLLKTENIHVLHMHTLSAGLSGALASWGLPVRKIYTGHSWRFTQKSRGWKRWLFYQFEKFTCWRSDEVTFSTAHDQRFGWEHGLLRPDRGVIIRTRIEPAVQGLAIEERARLRQDLGLPVDSFLVGTIAHLSARKDPLTFVRVASRVAQSIPQSRFLWVGDGELKSEVVNLARQLRVEDRLQITGIISPGRINLFLSVMDLFLFTSRNEGVPLSVLAAQQHGLPVICSQYEGSGVEELVQHGETGWVFQPGDDQAAAELVTEVFANPATRQQVVAQMQTRFSTLHSRPVVMAEEFAAIYLGLPLKQ